MCVRDGFSIDSDSNCKIAKLDCSAIYMCSSIKLKWLWVFGVCTMNGERNNSYIVNSQAAVTKCDFDLSLLLIVASMAGCSEFSILSHSEL